MQKSIVSAPVVIVSVGGADTPFYRGDYLDGVSDEELSLLRSQGLVADVEVPDAPVALADQTVADLREYAAEHNIDLTGATVKADVVAAIESAGPAEG